MKKGDGWEFADHVGQVLVLGGFVVGLVFGILQVRGLVTLSPSRSALVTGGIVAAAAGVVFVIIGGRKLYDSSAPLRYHHPAWDLLVGVALVALAVACLWTQPRPSAHAHPPGPAVSASAGPAA
jgi:peptidoglycan/LPS O-acetylase OafA/YrhL